MLDSLNVQFITSRQGILLKFERFQNFLSCDRIRTKDLQPVKAAVLAGKVTLLHLCRESGTPSRTGNSVNAAVVAAADAKKANSESPPSPHSQLARANSRPPVTAIVNFLETHGGDFISFADDHGFVVTSGAEAQLHGIMPSNVHKRVRHAVESLVPAADKGRGLVLGFENYFVHPAQGQGHGDDDIRITLHGIEQYPNGCWLDVDKEGKIVPGMSGVTCTSAFL
ncbi:hypothetical protein EV368DRAFT_66574 [Lentinula lateritia]|nr:hypothetical protein EV368DRAFT_66574 [Lentinula lateritia]